jgi:hypothetical protein
MSPVTPFLRNYNIISKTPDLEALSEDLGHVVLSRDHGGGGVESTDLIFVTVTTASAVIEDCNDIGNGRSTYKAFRESDIVDPRL